jgi:uncharacterized membrane protein
MEELIMTKLIVKIYAIFIAIGLFAMFIAQVCAILWLSTLGTFNVWVLCVAGLLGTFVYWAFLFLIVKMLLD